MTDVRTVREAADPWPSANHQTLPRTPAPQRMDRRAALQRLAGGAITGTVLIGSHNAFADGGSASVRPTCPTAATGATDTKWSASSNPRKLTLSIAMGTGTVCSAGWTVRNDLKVRATSPTTTLAVSTLLAPLTDINNTWTNNMGTLTISRLVTGVGGGSIAADHVLTTVRMVITVRRVCINNANPARKSWCCTQYTYEAVYNGPNQYNGIGFANFPTGVTPVAAADGCDAP